MFPFLVDSCCIIFSLKQGSINLGVFYSSWIDRNGSFWLGYGAKWVGKRDWLLGWTGGDTVTGWHSNCFLYCHHSFPVCHQPNSGWVLSVLWSYPGDSWASSSFPVHDSSELDMGGCMEDHLSVSGWLEDELLEHFNLSLAFSVSPHISGTVSTAFGRRWRRLRMKSSITQCYYKLYYYSPWSSSRKIYWIYLWICF